MKKALFAGGLVCVVSAFMPAMALAAGIDGTGSMPTCPTSGTIKIKPGLITGGILPAEVKVVAKNSGACSGGFGDGLNVVGVKMKGSGTTANNECSSFDGTTSTDVEVTFKWKVAKDTPKLNASTGMFSFTPGDPAPDGNATWTLAGTITSGSFTGTNIESNIESDASALDLVAGVCSDNGLKKVLFGKDDQTASCMVGPDLVAAITKQITSLDGNDVPHLELELTTLTDSPFEPSATDLTSPPGMLLESLDSTCTLQAPGRYRCRHTAFYASTGACQWDGNYSMTLTYACDPSNTCNLCSETIAVTMTLDSENFCSTDSEFCVVDLSCTEAVASASTGGVPCCSDTYSPLIQCLEQHCSAVCSAVISGDSGIAASSPCQSCTLYNCHSSYSVCSADNQACVE
ncbi:MAG TPA: hypothetical protein VEL28_14530 [Candidatus Binatia bacterium]|nr:hypothetical protein [Candidatus Binatia bacterium]